MRRLLLPLVTIGLGALVFKLAATPSAQDDGTVGDAVSAVGPGVLVLDLQDHATEADIAALEARLGGVDLEWSSAVSEDEGLVRATVDDLGALVSLAGRDPLVELAEAEVTLTALEHPNDPLWEKQWNLRQIGVHRGWRVGAGAGVTVAVIDTGVSAVEDLEGATILSGRSFVPGVSSAEDDHGHGTHVAGTIAQVTNNGVGVAGVAPGVTILPLKTLSARGSGSSDHIAAAIDEAVDQGAHVINLSLGGGYSEIIHKAVIAARDEGVLVFAAAGNDGRRSVSFPGALPEALGVGAVGPDDVRSFYSNFGPGVDLAAPGGNTKLGEEAGVLQDTLDGNGGHAYRFFQGTSMATPHAAGAAAVLLGMGLSPEETTATILGTSVDLGAKGFDEEYGHGRLSLDAAVTRVLTRSNALSFAVAGLMALVLARGARSPWGSALGVGLVAGRGLRRALLLADAARAAVLRRDLAEPRAAALAERARRPLRAQPAVGQRDLPRALGLHLRAHPGLRGPRRGPLRRIRRVSASARGLWRLVEPPRRRALRRLAVDERRAVPAHGDGGARPAALAPGERLRPTQGMLIV
ncbi:MAG: S8 family serine peptidase [Deltaproteobacteria bacterium]|nr:S8 family serine peptidase [Deltaproteobacteria bacterium]